MYQRVQVRKQINQIGIDRKNFCLKIEDWTMNWSRIYSFSITEKVKIYFPLKLILWEQYPRVPISSDAHALRWLGFRVKGGVRNRWFMGHNLKHSKAKLFCEIKKIIQAFSYRSIIWIVFKFRFPNFFKKTKQKSVISAKWELTLNMSKESCLVKSIK